MTESKKHDGMTYEQIYAEALDLLLAESAHRSAMQTIPGFYPKAVTAAELSRMDIPPPTPEKVSQRAWAKKVCGDLTGEEWDTMVWGLADTVPHFKGNVISFFENVFECLTLKDGSIIYH